MSELFDNKLKDLKELLYGKSSVTFDNSINNVTSEILNNQKLQTTTIIELLQKALRVEEEKKAGPDGKKPEEKDILKSTYSIINKALERKTVSLPGGRSKLYSTIDEVYNYNPEVQQALNVYVDNVLSPDIFTKNSIDIINTLQDMGENIMENQVKSLYYAIRKQYKLESTITGITSTFLKYGDNFVEIRNPKEELELYNLLDDTIEVKETNTWRTLLETSLNEDFSEETVSEDNAEVGEFKNLSSFDFVMPANLENQITLLEAKGDDKTKNLDKDSSKEITKTAEGDIEKLAIDNKDAKKLNKDMNKIDGHKKSKYTIGDLSLKAHSPKSVLALVSDDFVIGYLIIENTKSNILSGGLEKGADTQVAKVVIERVMKNIKSLLKVNNIKNDSEALLMIQHLLKLQKQKQGKITTRFVAPDKMVHFKLEPSQYGTYGESIFQPILTTGTLLTALRMALVIYRLARAPEKRVVNIETGLTKDAASLIEQVQSEFDRREVTVDKLGTVDSISSIVSSFETVYLPMTNGKKFVEMDVLAGGQLADKVEDANFILKEVLSGLGIPPEILGFERHEEAKSSISQQNVMFARTIVGIQKQASTYLTELFLKITAIVAPDLYLQAKSMMKVVLKPPRALMLESLSQMADEVEKLASVFQKLKLPTESFVKFYLGDIIDPEWLKMYQFKEELEQTIGDKEGVEPSGGESLGGL